MPATYDNLFARQYALYDSEDGKTYRIKIRTAVGNQTGLAADGNATGGVWSKNKKYTRKAHYKGQGADVIIKRSYPCSNAYWTQHADLAHTISVDGLTLQLTGFTGEKLRGGI